MTLPLKESPLVYVSKLAKRLLRCEKNPTDGLHYLVGAAVPFLVDLLVLIKNWSSYRYYTC